MGLVTTAALVDDAVRRATPVLAFNAVTLEHIEAITEAAESRRTGVIIQISENAVGFHRGRLTPLVTAAVRHVEESPASVSVHLDHVTDPQLLRRAVAAGCSSVMVDASALSYQANVELTRDATEWAHAQGLWVEAELGRVGGKGEPALSAHAPGARTDPDEAVAFVRATGVDALAVAVGSSHAMTERKARLDHDLIARLAAATRVPLVLHGSSGVPSAELVRAAASGVVKINVGTAVGVAFVDAVRRELKAHPGIADPRALLSPARDAMRDVVTGLLDEVTSPG